MSNFRWVMHGLLFVFGPLLQPFWMATGAEPLGQRHLIIAPEKFQAALLPYIAHKNLQMPTTCVSLETALKAHGIEGADDAEKLKRFLYAKWTEDKIGYVLLVGDADVLPVRYMVLDRVTKPAFDYAFYPSDLYYSDLAKQDGSFDDWNSNREGFHAGYFGEVRGEANKNDPINFDQIDYRPDIAVGRWPVSTEKEVSTLVEKTIRYETAVLEGNKPGLHNAALFSVGGWVDSRPVMDGVANRLGETWDVYRCYYVDRPSVSLTKPDRELPTEATLVKLFNQGVSFAIHAGHGQDESWDQCFPLSALEKIRNADRLPVVISAGCSTARFATLPPYEAYRDVDGQDHEGSNFGEIFEAPPPPPACYQSGKFNPTGLGEQLLRRSQVGAVAYIGCNTGSQPCGLTLLTGFANSYKPQCRLGDCWNGAVSYYYDQEHLATLKPDDGWYPPSIFFQAMKFMCFGDPTLVLP